MTAAPRATPATAAPPSAARVPRLGFLGVGWIGRQRMAALAASGAGRVAALVDPAADNLRLAQAVAPDARVLDSAAALAESDLDGIVIATPSALHADQATAALERGKAVFCQKPLARSAAETRRVVAAARAADRLLAVDFSYRFAEAMRRVAAGVRAGEIGRPYAAELVFHNAYGPDKAWCYDPALAGGGCLMDLGVHLVDLAFWVLDDASVGSIAARLFADGEPVGDGSRVVEDFAVAQFDVGPAAARLACSWRLPAGREAIIEATFYGTRGALSFRNVAGSFYDFAADRFDGTRTERLVNPPDAWGGRALVDWAERVAAGEGFDPSAERLVAVAETLDGIYQAGRAADPGARRPA
ncbi:MAG TPA: Gfo/Idh/MocA family oxidoreductase [Gemmatimonadales bacterium]|nr:Gfo/Idh/MocA family oxidoreductase [Gemmatimonadales bacterium]